MASRFETAKGRSTQIVNQWLAQRSLPDKILWDEDGCSELVGRINNITQTWQRGKHKAVYMLNYIMEEQGYGRVYDSKPSGFIPYVSQPIGYERNEQK
jgi:hypothetical protein